MEYHFDKVHQKGVKHQPAAALSRISATEGHNSDINDDIQMRAIVSTENT